MNLLSFHRLSPVAQQEYALSQGVQLDDRVEPKYTIHLYAVDGFYVELYFYRTAAQAVKITAFDSTKLLEPYLNTIDLSELHSFLQIK
jgi:hypothetical protein